MSSATYRALLRVAGVMAVLAVPGLRALRVPQQHAAATQAAENECLRSAQTG